MATITSILEPSKSQGSKVSKVQSIYNPINFVLNLSDASLSDKIQMKVIFSDSSESELYTYSVLSVSSMTRNVSRIIKSYIKKNCPLQWIDFSHYIDNEAVLKYKIAVRFLGDTEYIESDWNYAHIGVFQLGHSLEGNFLEYLTVFDTEGANVGEVGKFLTKFDKPILFKGFPFFLKYFTPQELNSLPITSVGFYTNGFLESIDDITPPFLTGEYIQIAETVLREIKNNVYVSTGGSLGEPVWSKEFNEVFWGNKDENAFALIERKYFDVVCTENWINPICICWINSLGGWDVWVFNKPTIVNRFTKEEYSLKPSESLLDTDFGTLLDREENIQVNCIVQQITENQYEALKEIIKSPLVYWLVKPDYYMQVKVSPGSFSKNTDSSLFDFSLEFEVYQTYGQF
jgi:hypothetical protein